MHKHICLCSSQQLDTAGSALFSFCIDHHSIFWYKCLVSKAFLWLPSNSPWEWMHLVIWLVTNSKTCVKKKKNSQTEHLQRKMQIDLFCRPNLKKAVVVSLSYCASITTMWDISKTNSSLNHFWILQHSHFSHKYSHSIHRGIREMRSWIVLNMLTFTWIFWNEQVYSNQAEV